MVPCLAVTLRERLLGALPTGGDLPLRPGKREAALTALALFGLAVALRVAAALAVSFPVPEDTAYYAGVARNFDEGRGLVSDSLWTFQTRPLEVPRAAFELWAPLPSLLAALPMAVAGTANWFRASQAASILVSAVMPVLAWRMAWDAAAERGLPPGRARTLAVGTGVLTAVLGPLVVYGALPDSTAPFGVLAMAACLVMVRVAARPSGPRDPRLVALGVLIGLAGLTRSEAVWLGLAWLVVAWFSTSGTARERVALVVVPGIVAAFVYAPWLVRDWLVFGTPLPGAAVSNALYVNRFDIFAWSDPPTLARYLGQGPGALLSSHLSGIAHNLTDVLLLPAFPASLGGLAGLPIVWRLRSVRPLLVTSIVIFAATSLIFPVSTLSGTFLHSAAAIYVLLAISCLFLLDAGVAAVGRIRHWTRPVAWLGPALAIAVAVPLTSISVDQVAASASDVQTRYEALDTALDRAGASMSGGGPVISNHPIWLAEADRVETLALPNEPPESVLSLARQFGATLVVLELPDEGRMWPQALEDGSAAARCFSPIVLTDTYGGRPSIDSPLARFTVFRIVCP
jgi:hypothetical protein